MDCIETRPNDVGKTYSRTSCPDYLVGIVLVDMITVEEALETYCSKACSTVTFTRQDVIVKLKRVDRHLRTHARCQNMKKHRELDVVTTYS